MTTPLTELIEELRELNPGTTDAEMLAYAGEVSLTLPRLLSRLQALEAVAEAAKATSECERKCAGKCPALPHEIDEVWTALHTALDNLKALEATK